MEPRANRRTANPVTLALLCAATVTGQVVAGKALRDTLFLTSLDITSLPAMLVTTSVVALVLVGLYSRCARVVPPSVLVPTAFLLSGALFLVEWVLRPAVPTASAIVLYLHISAAGPLLGSG
jgi:AAA family ATP:ADP antiporter